MKFFKWGLMLMFLTLAFFSCKDDESVLGENFLDGTLDLQFDTVLNVTTLSVAYEDTTIVRSGAAISLIGDYSDPIFGDHKAITAFSLIPQSNIDDDTSVYYADTLIMYMQYRGTYYGYDTTNAMNFTIHRVTDTLNHIDSTTIGTINIHDYYDPTPLATTTYVPGTDSIEQYLQFELPLELGDSILANWDKIASDSAFFEYFLGFVIKAENQDGSGSIVSFNFADTDSRLYLKFHSDDEDDLSFNFYISDSDNNLSTMRFNFFEHDYSTGTISQYMTSLDAPQFNENDELAFIQAMRGINMKVSVDMAASEFFNSEDELVINRAYMKLHTIDFETLDDSIIYRPPGSITITELKNDVSEPIVDYYLPSYDLSQPQGWNTSDSTGYEVILSGFTHEKVDEGTNDYTIWIRASQPSVSANRAVICGSNYPVDSLRPKIYVTYSKRTNN